MRHIDEVIIHCSATRPNWLPDSTSQARLAEIRVWHVKDRGWTDIGYHFCIDRDGTVLPGRPVSRSGAHTKGHNATTIGVCLFGGHGSNKDDDFFDHFTEAQDKALRKLLEQLKLDYPEIRKISGHNEYANKACPGFNVMQWLSKKPAVQRTSPTQSKTVQASAIQIASGAGATVSAVAALDGYAQLAVIGFASIVVVAGMFILRERLKAWAAGWR